MNSTAYVYVCAAAWPTTKTSLQKARKEERERRAVQEGVFGYILLPAQPLKKIFSEQKQINSGF